MQPETVTQDALYQHDAVFAPHLARLKVWSPSSAAMDLAITLGGDGTLLHCTGLFQRAMPPIMAYALGSLGFLTPFSFDTMPASIRRVMHGDCGVTLRIRLQCEVVRRIARTMASTVVPAGTDEDAAAFALAEAAAAQEEAASLEAAAALRTARMGHSPKRTVGGSSGALVTPSTSEHDDHHDHRHHHQQHDSKIEGDDDDICAHVPEGMSIVNTTHVLNEVVIDRGPAAYISNLDVYCNGTWTTCVQGDGLIVATPTGSTAYSVSAGGSMVHPSLPAILLTPICPHSLSFRPIIVPSTVELKVQVPLDARNSAWVSMDGRNRLRLDQGDYVRIVVSKYPVRRTHSDL